MKKTLNQIFDEANAHELEKLVSQNAASDVSADTLSSIKNKVYAKTKLKKYRKNQKGIWLRLGAVAACLLLIVSAVIIAPMLKKSKETPTITEPDYYIPSISTIASGNKITGKQELIYGNPSSVSESNADIIAPGFYLGTVIEVEVIEVLPDTYYNPEYYSYPLHVAKLRIIDSVFGEGLPEDIYLYYPYYDTEVLIGYERFIMSLEQVGVENYMLINSSQSRVDYFSNMFTVWTSRDIGYGSVVAFNNGIVDESFWDGVTHSHGSGTIKQMLDWDLYPIWRGDTVEQAKENIRQFALENDEFYPWHCNYVTVDDIFISEEGKEIQSYVAPSSSSVFLQGIYIREDRVIADYTRVINGFLTDEKIVVNGYNGENGNVQRYGEIYTEEDLAKIPDIGSALEKLDLSKLAPPHIKITDEMVLGYANATGIYRKIDGKIYGVIRVMWYYSYPDLTNACQMDDLYYLYDSDTNGSIVERDELKAVIGDDSFIEDFPYDSMISWS